MGQMNADFAGGEPETFDVRRHQVENEQAADEIPPREEHGDAVMVERGTPDIPAAEVACLRGVKSFIHLCQCSKENQQQSCHQ